MYSTSPIRVRQKFVESTSKNQVLVEPNGQAYPRREGKLLVTTRCADRTRILGVGWACVTNSRYLASMDLPERWALGHGPASDAAAMSPRPDAQERPLQGKSNDRNGRKESFPIFARKTKLKYIESPYSNTRWLFRRNLVPLLHNWGLWLRPPLRGLTCCAS